MFISNKILEKLLMPTAIAKLESEDVALLFQLLEYIQLDSKVIPDDLTCIQLLQQWHVPRSDELEEPILYEHFI